MRSETGADRNCDFSLSKVIPRVESHRPDNMPNSAQVFTKLVGKVTNCEDSAPRFATLAFQRMGRSSEGVAMGWLAFTGAMFLLVGVGFLGISASTLALLFCAGDRRNASPTWTPIAQSPTSDEQSDSMN